MFIGGSRDTVGANLNLLDLILLAFEHGRAAQKIKYFDELFPSHIAVNSRKTVFASA